MTVAQCLESAVDDVRLALVSLKAAQTAVDWRAHICLLAADGHLEDAQQQLREIVRRMTKQKEHEHEQ